MPQRQNIRRVKSTGVQGDDSFVTLRRITLAESKEFRGLKAAADAQRRRLQREALEADPDAVVEADGIGSPEELEFLGRHVTDWNWVDDEGVALPKPKEDPTVMQRLTTSEYMFLTKALTEVPDNELKN